METGGQDCPSEHYTEPVESLHRLLEDPLMLVSTVPHFLAAESFTLIRFYFQPRGKTPVVNSVKNGETIFHCFMECQRFNRLVLFVE